MKKTVLILMLSAGSLVRAQSVVQTVNSGSIIAANSVISVGEIFVIPDNPQQAGSGIIAILAQVNQQNLEVSHFDLAEDVVAYPNPTTSGIIFRNRLNLSGQQVTVFGDSGQVVLQRRLTSENSVDLSALPSGIYLIQFADQRQKTFKIIKH